MILKGSFFIYTQYLKYSNTYVIIFELFFFFYFCCHVIWPQSTWWAWIHDQLVLYLLMLPCNFLPSYIVNTLSISAYWDYIQYFCISIPKSLFCHLNTFPPKIQITSDLCQPFTIAWDFPSGSDGKESTCNAGDLGSILELGRNSGEGNGYPFQYSYLVNSMDRGAWQSKVHGVANSWTWMSDFTLL